MVSGLSSRQPDNPQIISDGSAASDIAALLGSTPVEGLDLEAIAQFSSVLRKEPVFNYQTVYGVIMIPSKQIIIPIN